MKMPIRDIRMRLQGVTGLETYTKMSIRDIRMRLQGVTGWERSII